MKKIFSAILFVSILLCLAAPAAFANSGGGEGSGDSGGRTLSAEQKRLVGNWTEKDSKAKVSFMFWNSGKGEISFNDYGEEGFAYAPFDSFRFDAETSEYVIEVMDGLNTAVIGRGRLVDGTGKEPEKLIISGSFANHITEPGSDFHFYELATYSYELVRESDLKSAKAPSVPGSHSIEVRHHWLAGYWENLPGDDPVELHFFDDDLIFYKLYDDDGELILESSSRMQWVDDEKAFRIVNASSWLEDGELQTAVRDDLGWLRPSAGANAASETMYLDFNCRYGDEYLVYQSTMTKVREPGAGAKTPAPGAVDEDDGGRGGSRTAPTVLYPEDADLSQAPDVIVEGSPSNLGGWRIGNKVTFRFNVEEEGDYLVTLLYSKQEYDGDRANLKISADGNSASAYLRFTGEDWSNYVEHEFGTLSLPAGETTLAIESTNPDGDGYVMNLRSVKVSK